MSSDQVAASSDSSSMATDEWSGSLTVPTPSRAPTVAAQRLKDVIPPLKLAGLQHGPPLRHTSSNGGGGSSRSSSSVAPFAQSHLPNLHSSVLLTPVSLGVSSHSAAPCGQLQLTGSHSGPLLPPALLGSGDDGIGSNNIATPRAQLQLASLPREPVARHASSQSSVSLRSGGSGGPSTQVQLASLEHRSLVSQASPSSGASGGNHRATLPMHLPLASSPDPAPVRQALPLSSDDSSSGNNADSGTPSTQMQVSSAGSSTPMLQKLSSRLLERFLQPSCLQSEGPSLATSPDGSGDSIGGGAAQVAGLQEPWGPTTPSSPRSLASPRASRAEGVQTPEVDSGVVLPLADVFGGELSDVAEEGVASIIRSRPARSGGITWQQEVHGSGLGLAVQGAAKFTGTVIPAEASILMQDGAFEFGERIGGMEGVAFEHP